MADMVQQTEQMDKGLFLLARLGGRDEDHALIQGTMPAGMFIPLHRHDDIECIHVTSGSLDVYVADHGGWYTLAAGESIVIRPDEGHSIRNVTDRPAETLVVLTARLARFIGELGTIAKAAGRERPLEERRQSLRELGELYGYWLASDSESEAIRSLPVTNARAA